MTSITMKTKTLRGALSGVARSVAKNGPMPILATCRLTSSNNSVTLTTTNLETTSSFTIECEGEGSSAACIDHGQLLATVSALTTETLTMVFGENSVTLKSGHGASNFTVTIPSLKEEDFPRAVAIDTEESEVESAALIRAFERAILTVATDQLRPTLTGVLVRTEESESDHGVAAQGRVVVASSDGFRMTVVTIATSWKPQECIIPAGFVNELIRLAESDEKLTIRMTDRIMEASTANQRTSGRLIDGKFPNINVIINRTKDYPAILMDKSGLLAAAKLCRLYVNKSAPRGTVTFDRVGTLTVQATGDQGSVVQHLAAEPESESNNAAILDRVDIGLNLSYLETAIKGASGARVTMAMASAMDPVVVRENDAEAYSYQHVIMPMSR